MCTFIFIYIMSYSDMYLSETGSVAQKVPADSFDMAVYT